MIGPSIVRRWRGLTAAGVLGLNRRNGDYIARYNPRGYYPRVDDKVITKELAVASGVAVPELYGVFAEQHEIESLSQISAEHDSFVVKPAHGAGGNGIVVITGQRNGRYQLPSGRLVDEETLAHHISGALSGLYSLGGQRDRALIEYCVESDAVFEPVAYAGVPDIRLIVLLGYPVMAMSRFPTRLSDGKANLHQGAVGAGIDLATGVTTSGVLGTDRISDHPDTGHPIGGIQIPHWDTILELAARAYEIVELGYIGVDIVIDRELGPLVLELNARPGMNIQIANDAGLLARLRRVEAEAQPGDDVATRIEKSRALFAPTPPQSPS